MTVYQLDWDSINDGRAMITRYATAALRQRTIKVLRGIGIKPLLSEYQTDNLNREIQSVVNR